jgi:hypothetical protein
MAGSSSAPQLSAIRPGEWTGSIDIGNGVTLLLTAAGFHAPFVFVGNHFGGLSLSVMPNTPSLQ